MANRKNDFPVPGIIVGPRDRSMFRTSDFWRRAHALVGDSYINKNFQLVNCYKRGIIKVLCNCRGMETEGINFA